MEKSITKFAISRVSFALVVLVATVTNVTSSTASAPRSQKKSVGSAVPANPLYPVGTEFTVGTAVREVLQPFDRLENPDMYKAAVVKETEGCKTLLPWEPVIVAREHWQSIVSPVDFESNIGILAIPAQSNCVKVGIPIRVAALDRATGITALLGNFFPTAIAPARPQFASQETLLRASAGLLSFEGSVVFVSGAVITNYPAIGGGRYAPRITGVRVIDRNQMETAIQDGTQIVDVRSKKQFTLAHVKGATHVPYTPGARMKQSDDYSAYAKSGDAFDIRRVNQDRSKPVILMGEGPYSDAVFRAAVVLRSEGWKNIFLFYEGMNYFTQMVPSPPVLSKLVNVLLHPISVVDLLSASQDVKLIDVRSEAEFAEATLRGAILAPYRERDDLRLHRVGLSGRMLTEYGDSWSPPASFAKTTPLVIFGTDGFDWRGYKAALVAKSMGFTNVNYFRPGFVSWHAESVLNASRYPTAGSGVTK